MKFYLSSPVCDLLSLILNINRTFTESKIERLCLHAHKISRKQTKNETKFSSYKMSPSAHQSTPWFLIRRGNSKGLKTPRRRRLTFVQVFDYTGFRFLSLQNIQTSRYLVSLDNEEALWLKLFLLGCSGFLVSCWGILMEALISADTCAFPQLLN